MENKDLHVAIVFSPICGPKDISFVYIYLFCHTVLAKYSGSGQYSGITNRTSRYHLHRTDLYSPCQGSLTHDQWLLTLTGIPKKGAVSEYLCSGL